MSCFRSLAFVSWEISANVGRHQRPGVDARGWLWALTRGDQAVEVVIEISETAWSSDPLRLPEDTRQALETDGRTELLKVLDHTTIHHVSLTAGLRAARIWKPRTRAHRLRTISRR